MTYFAQSLGDPTVSIAVDTDDEGLVLLGCPGDARHQFKVRLREDVIEAAVRSRVQPSLLGARGSGHWCPYCGYEGGLLCFAPFLRARIEAALQELEDQVLGAAVKQLRGTAREFNRRVGGGTLGLRMDVTAPPRSHRSWPVGQPSEATRLDLVCARCGERHATYGRAGFCWWCGPLAPAQTAKEGLRSLTARLQLANREDLPETLRDYLEDHGLHEALETDVYVYGLSLVEAMLLAVHEEASGEEVAKPVNWSQWPKLLKGVIDLNCPEWTSLTSAVQIRNSIVHRGARVDARLLQNTEIPQQLGERIRIDRGAAADHLAALERLVEVVDQQLPTVKDAGCTSPT